MKTDWFNDARFGMFIHWGPYSAAARGEWIANRESIPQPEYTEKCVNKFRAEAYDPAAWAALAKDVGMKYVVLTTKHHDGFCLWDTKTTDYCATKLGPKRDLLAPFLKAMRDAGLRVGLYFSAADWYHPDYPGVFFRDWPDAWEDPEKRARFVAFYHAQLEELMTQYGKIDILWYDGCIPMPLDGEVINTRVKQLQPDILITNRNGAPWDIQCCEQAIRPAPPGIPWEACMTLNDNWGYHAGDDNWKSPRQVLRMLAEIASNAGNLLLNVGPSGDGTIPEKSCEILRNVGQWLRANGEFLPSSSRSPFTWHHWGVVTTRENKIYLHVHKPTGVELCMPDIKNRIIEARVLASSRPLPFRQLDDRLFIDTSSTDRESHPLVIALTVEGTPESTRPQQTFWIPG